MCSPIIPDVDAGDLHTSSSDHVGLFNRSMPCRDASPTTGAMMKHGDVMAHAPTGCYGIPHRAVCGVWDCGVLGVLHQVVVPATRL